MNPPAESTLRQLPSDDRVARLRAEISARWRSGDRVPVEQYLSQYPDLSDDDALVMIFGEVVLRWESGETPTPDEYVARFSKFADVFPRQFELERALRDQAKTLDGNATQTLPQPGRKPAATNIAQAPAPEVNPTEIGPQALPFSDSPYVQLLAPAQFPDEIGRLGDYRVLRVVGSGGMAVVFEAEDPRLRRRVAMKVMKPEIAASPDARERFLREAQSVAALQHDHVIAIHQVAEDRGVPFFVMPLLAGESLYSRLKRSRQMEFSDSSLVAREIASGLAAAHSAGLIHRDIKPANLWLESMGQHGTSAEQFRVKILDFGLARPETGGDQISTTGAVVGTPAYMAPEQAHGRKVDFRADLFSLGCVLYEITTGRRAFSGETNLAVLMSIASDNPPSPHDLAHVDRRLSDLTMQLLEKDPLRRPASAAIVQRLLAGIEMSQASGRIAPGPAQSRTLPRFLSERYELTTRLAETDMFTVYKAFDNAIGSNVAVKVLDSELSLDRSNVQRFHALVKNLQTIKNYHVVPILDFGEHNGELYCVMPLLDGQTLTERLKSEQLDVPHAVAIGRQIANGLEAIHERRLVHRSIQPANIWLKSQSEPDAPKLLRVDAIIIGFAATQLPQDRMAYTERGKRVVEGTPGCAAPEQVNGRVVDNRADIFSFGTLLYVLLTGQKPFPSRGWHQYIASLCSVVPAPPVDVAPRVPKELSSLVMQMMAIRKEERPKSAAVVSMELAAIEDQFSKD